jgi:phospholipid/cholesterol/gamma-HCH transport system permease protein
MLKYSDQLGKSAFDLYRDVQRIFVFIYLSFRCTLALPLRSFRPILFILVSQVYFTGFMALPLITFIALATGSIIVLQSAAQLSILGSQEIMGNILVVTIVRELGPMLTALVVISRSGTAVASELGTMQVNREIEALRTMSIEPLSYVVFPRVVGGVLSLVCLAFYFNCIALIGGYFVANLVSNLSFSFYLDVLAQAISPSDFTLNFLKNSISGFLIFAIACDQGLKVRSGPHEVPIATTRAVVRSIIAVMAFNLSVTVYLFVRAMA